MRARLSETWSGRPEGQELSELLSRCVHCGMCNATCPTFQLTANELDSPRGRIYQVMQIVEDDVISDSQRLHLDRCLSCRACESTCPSGVEYGRIAEIGRGIIEREGPPRPWFERVKRSLIVTLLLSPRLIRRGAGLVRFLRPLLPRALSARVQPLPPRPAGAPACDRFVIALDNCVEDALMPNVHAALVEVFGRVGIEVRRIRAAGCCGALSHHAQKEEQARQIMKRNLEAWRPHLQQALAVVSTSSACTLALKDYGRLLAEDGDCAETASLLASKARDPLEILATEELSAFAGKKPGRSISFHSPCTLQHGLNLAGVGEKLLAGLGFELVPLADNSCCGAAGTYSLLQPDLSRRLQRRKLAALEAAAPEVVATANIGCLLHLKVLSPRPVMHWLEVLAQHGAPLQAQPPLPGRAAPTAPDDP